jgi:hypothetical protein
MWNRTMHAGSVTVSQDVADTHNTLLNTVLRIAATTLLANHDAAPLPKL